jgi:hypothetical protein
MPDRPAAAETPDRYPRPGVPAARGQQEIIALALKRLGYHDRAAKLAYVSTITGRHVGAMSRLSFTEAAQLIVVLGQRLARENPPQAVLHGHRVPAPGGRAASAAGRAYWAGRRARHA